MRRLGFAAAFVFVVILPSIAHAAPVLSTSPLTGEGANFVECWAVNVSEKSVTLRIRIFNEVGALLLDSDDIPLEARQSTGFATEGGTAWCQITVVHGPKGAVRGRAGLVSPGGTIAVVPAE